MMRFLNLPYSRLKEHGLLPEKMGWYPERITIG